MSEDLERVRELAGAVKDSYPDFVTAMVNGAKRHGVASSLIEFMESNENAGTDDVLEHYYTVTILA